MQALMPWQHWRLRQWLFLLFTLAAFILLCKLALWQWHRADEKQHLLTQQATWQQQGTVPWRQLPVVSVERLDGIRLSGHARWLQPAVWLLDNQVWQGQPGYDVVIPVLVDEQPPALLVNLGWLAAPASRQQLPTLQIPAEFELLGLLRTNLGGVLLGVNLEQNGQWPVRMQQILPTELSAALGQKLYNGVFYQRQSPYQFHYQPVVLPPEKHRAYAVQWALLALAVLVVAAARWRKEI